MRCLRIAAAAAVMVAAMVASRRMAWRSRGLGMAANSRVIIDYIDPRLPRSEPTLDRLRKRQVLEELTCSCRRCACRACCGCGQSPAAGECLLHSRGVGDQSLLRVLREPGGDRAAGDVAAGLYPDEVIVGGFIDAIFHELGHALFDMLSIPVFGREEDAADQLSAFLMLQFGKDVARTTIRGAAFTYLNSKNPRTRTEFADEHGTNAQRFFNYVCLAYGGEPEAFREYADCGVLPKARAEGCSREYQLVRRAFAKTIYPHIDQELMKKVQSVQWLVTGAARRVGRQVRSDRIHSTRS